MATSGNPYYVLVQHYYDEVPTTPTFRICIQASGTTGVTDQGTEYAWSLVVDASAGVYTIRFAAGVSGSGALQVLDATGRIIQQHTVMCHPGAIAQLDLGQLPAGTYLVSVITSGRRHTQRIARL